MIIAVAFIASISSAQTVPPAEVDKAVEKRIKKQILVSDTENRIRELNFAAPRVMARYRVARWLWQDGKDDIGRAEEFAILAIDDLYKNRNEIPDVYFSSLSTQLFALLERRAPNVSKTLKEKHKVSNSDESAIQNSLLDQPGQEKAAVDSVIRSLYSNGPVDFQLVPVLFRLNQRNSPELYRLLDNIIAAEERVPGRVDAGLLLTLAQYFAGIEVQSGTFFRYATIVLNRSRFASQQPFAPFDQWLNIVNAVDPIVQERAAVLVSDFGVVRAVLQSRISQVSRDSRERDERINNSIDKLGALIDEAEKTDDPLVKYDLYKRAAMLALDKNLFRRATDLTLLFGEVDISTVPILQSGQRTEVGQLLDRIVAKALKTDDDSSAIYATERHLESIRKANGFADVSKYFVDKGNIDAARSTMQYALRATTEVEDLPRRASTYFQLIPIAQKIDPTSVFEINTLAARSINSIPSLNPEDKPETENFKDHVSGLMIVNWNLLPMFEGYAKLNRNGSSDLASRIEKKEIKVFADFLLGVSAIENESNLPQPEEETTGEN